jgi:integrase
VSGASTARNGIQVLEALGEGGLVEATIGRQAWDIVPARRRPATWWQTGLDHDALIEHVCGVARDYSAEKTSYDITIRLRRALPKVLAWLGQWEGSTWQERWLSSGTEQTGDDWIPAFLAWRTGTAQRVNYDEPEGRSAMAWMMAAQVLRPSMEWVLGQQFNYVLVRMPKIVDPDGYARLLAHIKATGRDGKRVVARATNTIGRFLLTHGGTISDITVGDCFHYTEAHRAVRDGKSFDRLFYTLLFEMGTFGDNAPDRLRAWTVRGQLTVPELVGRYAISCTAVSDLLVDYFTIRSADLDYSSLRHAVQQVCQLWWKDLEDHHPGIETLHMTPEMVTAWKERLRVVIPGRARQGEERRGFARVLLAVRGFYLDIAQFAAHNPAQWGPWVTPCPIAGPGIQAGKERKRAIARMHQRTRQLAPTMPTLLAAARAWHQETETLLGRVRPLAHGATTEISGQLWRRLQGQQSDGIKVFLAKADDPGDDLWDLTLEEEYSFWAWAATEALQSTGIRIEELLELTHYSFSAYALPSTGEVVPLLQVTPSKSDRERVILVSPELGEVLAEVIHRVRAGQAAIPLISRYDRHEQVFSPRLPFLFQRRRGGIPVPLGPDFIQKVLEAALARTGLADAAGQPLHYTPHDFRRIFTTDAIRSGLPPHIAAKILGHDDVNTTMAYANPRELHQAGEDCPD